MRRRRFSPAARVLRDAAAGFHAAGCARGTAHWMRRTAPQTGEAMFRARCWQRPPVCPNYHPHHFNAHGEARQAEFTCVKVDCACRHEVEHEEKAGGLDHVAHA